MQELDVWIVRFIKHGTIHLIWLKQGNPLGELCFLAHRHPHVGIDRVSSLQSRGAIIRHGNLRTSLGSNCPGEINQLVTGVQLSWR